MYQEQMIVAPHKCEHGKDVTIKNSLTILMCVMQFGIIVGVGGNKE